MSNPPTREEVAAFLTGRGYRSYPLPALSRHDVHWQRPSGVTRPREDGEALRGRFDVREWHRDTLGGPTDGYEVGASFPTAHGWLRLFFYSLNAERLLARLPALEAEIRAIQERLMGEEKE